MSGEHKSGQPNNITKLLRLPEDRLVAQVPADSQEYQLLLGEQAELERIREEKGYLEAEDYDKVRVAADAVSLKASEILRNSRSS